ncbi:P-type conjugative transfer protein TrbL [Massilia sp. TSP1-1-2]|uniref:P-type conjugative transfer protein TrbL n=1 Tax=Massilia sp. TSP1-1-2 TaxID=2804649 RepID=UPI003CF1DD47
MSTRLFRNSVFALFLAAMMLPAIAAPSTGGGLLNDVTLRFYNQSATWGVVVTGYATWLFWALVTISMVWTFGMMALRKADIGEFFAEFVKFTITTGFFWWLLSHGPAMAVSIIKSMQEIGARAAGTPIGVGSLQPSMPVAIGLDIVKKAFLTLSWTTPINNLGIVLISAAVLVCMCVVAANILIALVNAWVMAYAGIFILGFGGSRWTSDMAIGYFKAMLGVGMELMTMTLLVGIATSVIDSFYANLDGSSTYELLVVFCVCAVLALLINKIPARLAGLAGGGSGAGVGAGTLMGGIAMAGAAVASGGAAAMAGAANAAGGAQALMAAFSKASASESGGGGGAGMSALMSAAGGSGGESGGGGGAGGGGGSALAAAMGGTGSSSSSSAGFGGSGGSSAGEGGATNSSEEDGGSAGSSSGGSDSSGSSGSAEGNASGSDSTNSSSGGGNGAGDKGTAGGSKGSKLAASAGAMAAKAGRIAAGTVVNLAQGSYDIAKERALEMKDSAKDRIADTTGGRIAAAIQARRDAASVGTESATFAENSLGAGAGSAEAADAAEEIAAFRDGNSKTS